MNKKQLCAVIGGVGVAGLICFIVGLIVYLTSVGKPIAIIISLFAIATGAIITAIAGIVLLIMLITYLITKKKDKR